MPANESSTHQLDRRSIERLDPKRRRLSPTSSIHSRGAPRQTDATTKMTVVEKCLLSVKEFIVPDLHYRYPSVLAAADLYRTVCHWQDSLPLLKPLQLDRSSIFQILTDVNTEETPEEESDSGFFVNVLLLSMPSTLALQDKTVVRAEGSASDKPPLRKYIRLLGLTKSKDRIKAIGGPWKGDLDGEDPAKNAKTLINTAIRVCKEQTGLDLSHCSEWHRFLEFRYGRTEGSTARPTSVLFPGSQLWGRSFRESSTVKTAGPLKPFHRIVVYFIPNVWSLMPTNDDWPNMKKAMELSFATEGTSLFPLSRSEVEAHIKRDAEKTAAAMKETTSGVDAPTDNTTTVPGSSASTTATTTKSDSTEGTEEVSTAEDKQENGADTEMTNSRKDVDASFMSTAASEQDKDASIQEVSELREQLKARNLAADGIKAQLLNRLKAAVEKEAEQAKKEEEERIKKEKELEEALAAKEAEEKKKEMEKPVPEPVVESKPKPRSVTLRNTPSIVVQQKMTGGYNLQSVSLDAILDTKIESMDPRSYEFILCVHNLLEMIRRDAIFTLFRALVTAGDRGVKAKQRPKTETSSDSRSDRSGGKDRDVASKEVPTLRTVDMALLCACTFLEPHNKGYFYVGDVEDMIFSLGLPVSRYQVRSLVMKVSDNNRIHYRTLTDAEVSPSAVKSTPIFSEIDDDEYLLELIRGGDAILDEQEDYQLPAGSVVVLHGTASSGSESTGSSSLEPNVFCQNLKQLESERNKLKRQLQSKIEEIERLRLLTDTIPDLKKKLSTATSTGDEYRRRLRNERDRMHAVTRVLDHQANNLDSSRNALRQASNRLRGRDDTSSSTTTPKKPVGTTEAKKTATTAPTTTTTTTETTEITIAAPVKTPTTTETLLTQQISEEKEKKTSETTEQNGEKETPIEMALERNSDAIAQSTDNTSKEDAEMKSTTVTTNGPTSPIVKPEEPISESTVHATEST